MTNLSLILVAAQPKVDMAELPVVLAGEPQTQTTDGGQSQLRPENQETGHEKLERKCTFRNYDGRFH